MQMRGATRKLKNLMKKSCLVLIVSLRKQVAGIDRISAEVKRGIRNCFATRRTTNPNESIVDHQQAEMSKNRCVPLENIQQAIASRVVFVLLASSKGR